MRVVGRSGIVIDVPEQLARGLIRSGIARPVTREAVQVEQAPATPPAKPEPAHRCDECGATAKSPAGLAAHKRSHSRPDAEQ